MCTYVSTPIQPTPIATAAESSSPCPPVTEKKPLVPPGAVGLGSNVIAQMKRRQTHGKELDSDKESQEQRKAKEGSEPAKAVPSPKDDTPQPAKAEVKGKWSYVRT